MIFSLVSSLTPSGVILCTGSTRRNSQSDSVLLVLRGGVEGPFPTTLDEGTRSYESYEEEGSLRHG